MMSAATVAAGAALALSATLGAAAPATLVVETLTPCSTIVSAPLLPSQYYGIEMVTTRRVPGTGRATGAGSVAFARSPFGVAVSPSGTYVYDLSLAVDRINAPRRGAYTAWAAAPDLEDIVRLGVVEEGQPVSGRVDWNKFLVIVTLEPSAEPTDSWQGPVVMRGMSRSGMMHTLAGHGPYENEPCLKYGFK
ncbi:MAG TPA: hypothetical protein DCP38_17010 [Acidobacteria bacterium]|jgi:hypothetical protein|nr:hypothetical protein [Acidobacteriota bacterium]HAK57157.1 hypothetical protein [Acidobacteriota bacterium]